MRHTRRWGSARSPSRNTPSAGSTHLRWQVSRLAEQDFSSDPRLPDLAVSGPLGISPVTVAGAAALGLVWKNFRSPIAFPLRLS